MSKLYIYIKLFNCGHAGQKELDESDDDSQSQCVVKFLLTIKHSPGSLWEVLDMFAVMNMQEPRLALLID